MLVAQTVNGLESTIFHGRKKLNTKYLRFWRVKFFDWLWFVFYLRCDEFSIKLDVYDGDIKSVAEFRRQLKLISKKRELAHRVEMRLTDSNRLSSININS